jgi:GntP family gluconate:H+ symporter
MHAMTPPHPGSVAAAEALGGNIGVVMLVGIPIGVIAWYVGVMPVSGLVAARIEVAVPD